MRLGIAALAAWSAWLLYGFYWEVSYNGPSSGWLLGPDKRMMVEPWRIYDTYRFLLAYAAAGVALAWAVRRALLPTAARKGGIVVALLLAGTVLGLLEWSVRVYEDRFRPLDMMFMVPDPALVWRIAPGSSEEINDLGLRSPAVSRVPEKGELRVLCIGDSCTFGVGMPSRDTYPSQLEGVLRRAFPGRVVTVLNAGVPGYSSVQGLEYLLRDGLALKPDLVVWSFAHTDVNSATLPDRLVLASQSRQVTGLADLLHRSHLYLYLNSEVNRWRDAHGGENPAGMRVSPAEARVVLREAARAVQAAGGRLIVLQTPDRHLDDAMFAAGGLGERDQRKIDHRRAMLAEARELGIPLIDPSDAFRAAGMGRCFLADDTIHPSGVGAEAIASVLGEQVARILAGKPVAPDVAPVDAVEELLAKADLPTLRAEVAELPHYAFWWAMARLLESALAPDEAQGGAVLSILRQGPAQMDAEAVNRVRSASDATLTDAQKALVRRLTSGADAFTVVSLTRAEMGQHRDLVGDGTTRLGVLLGSLLDRLAGRVQTNWLEEPIELMLGARLAVPPEGEEPLATTLYGLLALHDWKGPEQLTREQEKALLPTCVALVESADFAQPHRRAIIDLLDERQARWILRLWRDVRRGPVAGEPKRETTAKDVPFDTTGGLFAACAARYRLPSGESALAQGEGRTALAIPYPDLIWGLKALTDSGHDVLTPQQARAIAAVMERLVAWTGKAEPVYAATVAAAGRILTPQQQAHMREHRRSPVDVAAQLRGRTPAGADIIGWSVLQSLGRTAQMRPFAAPAMPPPRGVPPGPAPNPGDLFAGILDLYDYPELTPDQGQSRQLIPYVRACIRANDENHLVKERIAETLTEAQRRFILDALSRRGSASTQAVSPGEVIQALRARAGT